MISLNKNGIYAIIVVSAIIAVSMTCIIIGFYDIFIGYIMPIYNGGKQEICTDITICTNLEPSCIVGTNILIKNNICTDISQYIYLYNRGQFEIYVGVSIFLPLITFFGIIFICVFIEEICKLITQISSWF